MEEQVVYNQQNLGIGATAGQARLRNDTLKENLDQENNSPGAGNDPSESISNQGKTNSQKMGEKVHQLARKSSQVLFRTKTVFPFDFFPDTLTINANKIDVVNSEFFLSNHTTSIPLRDIANVEIQTSPFFAKLIIINIRYPMQPVMLQYLKKSAAVKAKKIIDGLLVAMSQGADVAAIEPKRFLQQIERVGESAVNG